MLEMSTIEFMHINRVIDSCENRGHRQSCLAWIVQLFEDYSSDEYTYFYNRIHGLSSISTSHELLEFVRLNNNEYYGGESEHSLRARKLVRGLR